MTAENLAFVLGIISLVISVLALCLAIISDKRMKALANLHFQEKLAIMANHLRTLSGDKSPLFAERILYDLEGASYLREYISKERKGLLIRDYVIPILTQYLSEEMERGVGISVKRIFDLANSYQIESPELEKIRQKARGIIY